MDKERGIYKDAEHLQATNVNYWPIKKNRAMNQDIKDITEFLDWIDSHEPVAYFVAALTLIAIAAISGFMMTHWGW